VSETRWVARPGVRQSAKAGPAALVVAIWGAANGLLTALLAGMGGTAVVLWIYGGAVSLTELVAAAAFIAGRLRPTGPPPRQPLGGGTALLFALGAALSGFGLAFGWWILLVAVPVFLLAAINEVYLARRKHQS
jgi:hypothetical protein